MRILIPSPRVADTFADNVAHALEKMGHEVFTAPGHDLASPRGRVAFIYGRIRRRFVRDYAPAQERLALEIAKRIRPAMVLALTQQLASQTLRELKRIGVRHRVIWWGDTAANMEQMGLYDDEWDAIFMKEGDAARKLRRVGLNAHLLHEAHNPDWHRPLATASNDRIVVAGNLYGQRQFLLRRLLEAGIAVDLYGPRPPRWADPGVAQIHTGRYIVKEEKSRIFGAGLACLNNMSASEGNSLNCRAFEVAGAAGLQLIEYRPAVEECFEPGKELLTFDSLPELLEHIDRARRFPAEVAGIREAGHRRARDQHTYQHRLEQIFRTVPAS